MALEQSNYPDGSEAEREAPLVEHSSSGRRFTRLFGDTFSLEDGFTLKHVAVVVAALCVVVAVFGLISLLA